MPLTEEDIPKLLARFEDRGRDVGFLHSPRNSRKLADFFVRGVSDPREGLANQKILRQAEGLSRERRDTQINDLFESIPGIQDFVTLTPDGDISVSEGRSQKDITDFIEERSRESTLAREGFEAFNHPELAAFVAGFSRAGQNIPGFSKLGETALGTDEFQKIRSEFGTALASEGNEFSSSIISGVAGLVPFLAVASGAGTALGATRAGAGLLGSAKGGAAIGTIVPFGVAGAVTGEPGARPEGAAAGAIAGVIGAVAIRAASKLAAPIVTGIGKVAPSVLSSTAGRAFASKIATTPVQFLAESAAFTGLDGAQHLFRDDHSSPWDPWTSFLHNMAIVGVMKGAKGITGEVRAFGRGLKGKVIKRPGEFSRQLRIRRVAAGFNSRNVDQLAEVEGTIGEKEFGRQIQKVLGLEPYEVEIARVFAERGAGLSQSLIDSAVASRRAQASLLNADPSIQTPSDYVTEAARIRATGEQVGGEGVDILDPTRPLIPELEKKLLTTEATEALTGAQEVVGDAAIAGRTLEARVAAARQAHEIRQVRERKAVVGVREKILAEMERLGEQAFKAKTMDERVRIQQQQDVLREQADKSISLAEFYALRANELRDVIRLSKFPDNKKEILSREAERLDALAEETSKLPEEQNIQLLLAEPTQPMRTLEEPGPSPAEVVARIEKAEAFKNPDTATTEDKLNRPQGLERFVEEQSPIPKKVKITDLQEAEFSRWAGRYEQWLAGGRKGRAPSSPRFVNESPLVEEKLVQMVERAATPQRESLNRIAARIAPTDSKLAQMVGSDDPLVVAEGIKLAMDGKWLISPQTEISRPPKSRKNERGVAIFPLATVDGKIRTAAERPKLTEAFETGEQQKADFLQEVVDTALPSTAGDVIGQGGGVEFFNPFPGYDAIRQNAPVIRKVIRAPFTDSLVDLHRSRVRVEKILEGTTAEWLNNTVARPLSEIMRGKTPEGQNAVLNRIFNARIGELDVTQLAPQEAKVLGALDQLFQMYRTSLQQMGLPVRDNNYITFIRDSFADMYTDASVKRHVKDVTSRFTKRRTNDDPTEVSKDLISILNIYTSSMNRMIAYRPVAQAITGMKEFYGVEGSTDKQFVGTPEARKAGLPKMPKNQSDWWEAQIQILQGVPGKFSQSIEKMAKVFWDQTAGRLPGMKGTTGRDVVGYWLSANYIGGLGFSPAAAAKNLLQNTNTAARIGPRWFFQGLTEFTKRRVGNDWEFSRLLEEMGWNDAGFAEAVRADSRSQLARHGFNFKDKLNEWAFYLFDKAEKVNRGIAGIGAYRKGLHLGMDHAEAVRFGKDIISQTQFDYDRVLGGQAFSGSAGKLLGQFARFQVNQFDFIQLMLRAAKGSPSAIRELNLQPGEQTAAANLQRIFTLLFAPAVVTMGLNTVGIHFDDGAGPLATLPDIVKSPLRTGTEALGQIVTGKKITVTDQINPVTGRLMTRPVGRDVTRFFGLETFGNSPGEILMGTFGPAVNQSWSLAAFLIDMDGNKNTDEVKKAFRIMIPTVQGDRLFRAIQEERDGFVRSRSTGKRLFPSDRNLTRYEVFLRAIGIESIDQEAALNAMTDMKDTETILNGMIGEVRKEAIERLQRGLPPEEAAAALIQGMSEMQDQGAPNFRPGDVSKEWKHILGKFSEGERFSALQRTAKQERFGRFVPER